jgi:hypothetical protein
MKDFYIVSPVVYTHDITYFSEFPKDEDGKSSARKKSQSEPQCALDPMIALISRNAFDRQL